LTQEFGATATSVRRLKFLRRMLISMGVIYMLVDWVYDTLLPMQMAFKKEISNSPQSWRATRTLMSDLRD